MFYQSNRYVTAGRGDISKLQTEKLEHAVLNFWDSTSAVGTRRSALYRLYGLVLVLLTYFRYLFTTTNSCLSTSFLCNRAV